MTSEDVRNISEIKARYSVPVKLQSCHTAIVDGYVLEGHVPKTEVIRLLQERPEVIGLSVPGMPIGSPGMEMPGRKAEPYEVLSFDKQGVIQVYGTYPK
ncbi:DUF411 domain-containing protein [Thermodesulfobacteriota bacterium]